jgi:hypothetical protein
VTIDAWAEEAGIGDPSTSPLDSLGASLPSASLGAGRTGGRVFRSVRKGGAVSGDGMSAQAVADVVREYAERCGFDGLAAHDLRRTFAKLAHKGGAKLDQIQLSLGHASIKTAERYLGVEQDLQDAPCDHLGLKLALAFEEKSSTIELWCNKECGCFWPYMHRVNRRQPPSIAVFS